MEAGKKLEVEFKQTVKGSWYVGSLKVGADNLEELSLFIDSTIAFLHAKLEKMNLREFKPALPAIELNDSEKLLFEKLRTMRMDLARAENIPPYIIFHDSVLRRLAKAKPLTREEIMKVDGVGEKTAEKYGLYFLKVITSFQNNRQ